MSPRCALLLVIGACGCGSLSAWLLSASSDGRSLDPVLAISEARLEPHEELVEEHQQGHESDLEEPESSMRDGRVWASEESANPAPEFLSELRTLPESTLAEMTHKRDALQELLTGLTEPLLEYRFRQGRFERLSKGLERYDAQDRPSEISSLRRGTESVRDRESIPGRASFRMVTTLDRASLPRTEYPALYELKDEVDRLNLLIQERALSDYYARKAEQALEAGW